jgi:hypothetical protein
MNKFATLVAVTGLTAALAGCSSEKPSEPKAVNGPDPKLQRAGTGAPAPTPQPGAAATTPPVTKD